MKRQKRLTKYKPTKESILISEQRKFSCIATEKPDLDRLLKDVEDHYKQSPYKS